MKDLERTLAETSPEGVQELRSKPTEPHEELGEISAKGSSFNEVLATLRKKTVEMEGNGFYIKGNGKRRSNAPIPETYSAVAVVIKYI